MAACSKRAAANRQNAKKSTGPRTAKGKDAVRKNARKHGLSTPIAFADEMPPKYEALALALAQGRPNAVAAARHASEVRFHLDRLRRAEAWLFIERFDELLDEGMSEDDPTREAVALRDIAYDWRKLANLTRKQESRWRKAMVALEAVL